jgi:hypothetical protein
VQREEKEAPKFKSISISNIGVVKIDFTQEMKIPSKLEEYTNDDLSISID